MSEPTVKIPVRLALCAARHLHHIGRIYLNGTTGEYVCEQMSAELKQHVVDQCSIEELRAVEVSIAELQEHT